MAPRCATLLLTVLLATFRAVAQPQTQATVTFTIEFQRYVQAGGSWANPPIAMPGLLQFPGEAALLRIRMTYSPPLGGPLTWDPAIQAGSSGIGTVAGFWSGAMDVFCTDGPFAGMGVWSDNTSAWAPAIRRHLVAPFTAGGGAGNAAQNGARLENVQPAQFAPMSANLAPDNGAIVWQGLWVPSFSSFNAPFIHWGLGEDALGLWSASIAAADQNPNYPLAVALRANYTFGPPVTVYVIPAPGGLALLAAGVGAARRRR